jgi:predicted HD superfamily hydrolase involved in NAD metabolism
MNDIKEFDEGAVLEKLKEMLGDERYHHALKVRDLALKLAEGRGIKRERVVAAALLHDIAKGMEREEMFRYAASHGISLDPGIVLNHKTLHQQVGAAIARRDFGINDASVLSAISKHATADSHMSDLDLIIYLADSLEEDRDYEGVEELRELAFRDLDEAFFQTLRRTMIYVLERSLYLDERSVKAYDAACLRRAEKSG